MWSEITDKWNEFAFQNNEKIENAKGNFGHAGRPGKKEVLSVIDDIDELTNKK